MTTVRERIERLLEHAGATWQVHRHVAGDGTAADLARARGTPLEVGGKAILMKVEGRGFAILALRACDAIDNRAFRTHLGARRYRFATPEELLARTGLVPGTVPPFGRPVFDLPLFADRALADGERIAFTPGAADTSFELSTADWLRAARPEEVFPFARAP